MEYRNRGNQRPIREYQRPTNIQRLIEFIFYNIRLSKYNYKILQYEDDLLPLELGIYHISPTYTGKNCLLVFKKIYDEYYSILIERSSLNYNINQIKYDNLIIHKVKIQLDEDIYKGTIIDGILLNCAEMEFVVNDVYMFCGRDHTDDKLYNKLINMQNYVKQNLNDDNNMNNLHLIINNIYSMKDIDKVITEYIPKLKHNKYVKGLTFYPDRSGTKYIYLYSNSAKTDIPVTNPGLRNLDVNPVRNNYSTEGTKILKIKKTDTIDVYQLCGAKLVDDKLKYHSVGIASIPTMQDSKFCRELLSDNAEAYVRCRYDNSRNKWTPIEKVNAKRPDIILP